MWSSCPPWWARLRLSKHLRASGGGRQVRGLASLRPAPTGVWAHHVDFYDVLSCQGRSDVGSSRHARHRRRRRDRRPGSRGRLTPRPARRLVLERAPRIDPAGAGITLFANAMRALDRLGVREAVEEQGAPAKSSAILTARGRRLTEVPSDLLEGAFAVHRADLQACSPRRQARCASVWSSLLSSRTATGHGKGRERRGR